MIPTSNSVIYFHKEAPQKSPVKGDKESDNVLKQLERSYGSNRLKKEAGTAAASNFTYANAELRQ